MPGQIALTPGPSTSLWNSDGIRLRSPRETNLQNIGNHIKPVSGSSYFTYVKVSNTGADPIGGCGCSKTGNWVEVTYFIDTFPAPTFPINAPDMQSKLVADGAAQFQLETSAGVKIAGPWPLRGQPATGGGQGFNSF
jgi:hypothetical protein